MPVAFIPNEGQVDGPAAFYVRGRDKTIYFAADGLTFVLSRTGESASGRWVVRQDFLGASPVVPASLEESGTVMSFFKGCPEAWRAGLPASSKIVYRELWPGIDAVYSGTVNRMKCEFIVRPGADPSRIRLAYRGAESVGLTDEGRLAIVTPVGGFEDDIPTAWQELDGTRTDVPVAYALAADETGSPGRTCVYGFDVGNYDSCRPLVLDPALIVYCGFIGGSGWEKGVAIAIDGSGCAYVTGDTSSTEDTFPVTTGPDPTFNGEPSDAFIVKVNAEGTGLAYCGFIGGSGMDEGKGVAVDGAGNAYITGETSSGDFPVSAGSSLVYAGDMDAFVAKVSADGAALVYSGYVGGWNWDTGKGIAVDASGHAHITGWTFSEDLPVKVGPDLTANGSQDAFVAKINADGTGFDYCGYIGGWANEEGKGIAVDGSGNAYVTGRAASDFPVKVGPDLTHNGLYDIFVAKVSASGSDLVYGGYIGGADDEEGLGIAVDGQGNAYVTGWTLSTQATFPVKVGPDLTYNGGDVDAFVAKVTAAGTGLSYCGYIGGGPHDRGYGNETGHGIAVDGQGNAYVTGRTDSSEATFPVTGGPDLTYNALDEAFVAKVNAAGSALAYCGFIGGEANEYGSGIAVDRSGDAYVTGETDSTEATFPVAVGPDLTFNGSGDYDGFVCKIVVARFTLDASPASATVAAGQSAVFTVQAIPRYGSFDAAITFSAGGLPKGCTASFSPSSLTPGADPASTALTLKTTSRPATSAAGGLSAARVFPPWAWGALLLLSALFVRHRSRGGFLARGLVRGFWSACLACALIMMAGCSAGDDGPSHEGTPAGTYQITVQGESGSVESSTQVTLIVQ